MIALHGSEMGQFNYGRHVSMLLLLHWAQHVPRYPFKQELVLVHVYSLKLFL